MSKFPICRLYVKVSTSIVSELPTNREVAGNQIVRYQPRRSKGREPQEKNQLLKQDWTLPECEIQTFVVVADPKRQETQLGARENDLAVKTALS